MVGGMGDGVATSPMGHRSLWHHTVRETWAGERLYFWRLRFPTYDRDRIRTTLRLALEGAGITSYAMYELFDGGTDVLLRTWVHSSHRLIEDALRKAFDDPSVSIDYFIASRVITHWPFVRTGESTMREVAPEALERPLSAAEVATIESGATSHAEYARLEDLGLVAPAPHSQGIKFMVSISGKKGWMNHHAQQRVEEKLLAILNEASDITEQSLYVGTGFAEYVILGRVSYAAFPSLAEQVTHPINSGVDPATFGARTTTSIVAIEDFLDFREHLHLNGGAPPERSVEEWLQAGESQTLEVKGSAFVDMNRYYRLGERATSDKVTDHGLVKAVCGMLNAQGGTLILGALERDRFADVEAVSALPRVAEYLCCGIGIDWMTDESLSDEQRWDRYQLALRKVLESRVRPDPNALVTIERDGIDMKPLCKLTIRAPVRLKGQRHRWYWHFPRGERSDVFWVRQGNRTMPLSGPEIDDYQAEF